MGGKGDGETESRSGGSSRFKKLSRRKKKGKKKGGKEEVPKAMSLGKGRRGWSASPPLQRE